MKKLAFLLILSCISVSYWFFSKPNDVIESIETVQEVAPEIDKNVNQLEVVGVANSPKPEMEIAPIATKKSTVKMERLPLDIGEIASISEEAKEVLVEAGVLVRDISEEAYVEFDLAAMQQLEVGDTFDLTIPQTTEMHRAEVTQVDIFPNGDKSVFAQVTGSDNRFHNSVMTVGSNAIYGQFTVSSGNYVFESHGKHGWIAAKRDLYKNHVEHTPVERAPAEGAKDLFSPPIKTQTTRKEN
ncbi:hypothetical protein N474_15800 [Pseudoalteromonas luteoviolacea CPMOR-2]|uniref:Flp pilus assembly protein CpaB n=1 Tax=Pseudoalteromonas luteoviolacea DSM 6061 TaxID=1365250 RepID=A0A166XRR2_9GAMM|nr:hypothetical protein [Pseudoalteromonas luteoviolacea]KZN40719.1 hypothetical protein N475_11365 [Pseudoalteromonas luteoviolacea DSM 6061]KZN55167.1 hypothetical protein N474_15800 [Pseudoalteromonas luteoviolacea CPMOR-2]MBE0387779.1 hypothetical protein [Pseudoalteromonas luteoviolacea DSM 6061]